MQTYIIETATKTATWRVFRSFTVLSELYEKVRSIIFLCECFDEKQLMLLFCDHKLKAHYAKDVLVFPAKKRFFVGGLFGGKFSESDAGEQRRLELAKFINRAVKSCSTPDAQEIVSTLELVLWEVDSKA